MEAQVDRAVDRKQRIKIPHTPYPVRGPQERVQDFDDIVIGYDAETAMREAGRCIQCPEPSACMEACPLHNDIPGAMWLISQGDFIGGGDTATDCMRTSLRMGAQEVTCYYRRTEAEMPGARKERHHAVEEGARIEYLVAPVEFVGAAGGHVRQIVLQRMELGEPDESGRRRPVPIEGSEFTVEVDTVVLALGYWPDDAIGETTPGLDTRNWGLIAADAETGRTSRPAVFAGGDAVSGPDLVSTAMAAGLRAGRAMHAYLSSLDGDREAQGPV